MQYNPLINFKWSISENLTDIDTLSLQLIMVFILVTYRLHSKLLEAVSLRR